MSEAKKGIFYERSTATPDTFAKISQVENYEIEGLGMRAESENNIFPVELLDANLITLSDIFPSHFPKGMCHFLEKADLKRREKEDWGLEAELKK